jgi:hypothetical protein
MRQYEHADRSADLKIDNYSLFLHLDTIYFEFFIYFEPNWIILISS